MNILLLEQNKYILRGFIVLKRDGKIVWFGPISAPWEDVDCDTAVLNPIDFDRVSATILDMIGRNK